MIISVVPCAPKIQIFASRLLDMRTPNGEDFFETKTVLPLLETHSGFPCTR